jgi:zinc-ribbon domain
LRSTLVAVWLLLGSPLSSSFLRTLRCPNCGYENDPGDVVCMGCGWPIGDDPGPQEDDEGYG